MFDNYGIQLTLGMPMLATNPSDPHVMDTHIIERQRKLITEKSKLNKDINKYLDALQIPKEKGQEEVELVLAKLEQYLGYELSLEERTKAAAGDIEGLRETFKELDYKGVTVFFWNKEKNLPMVGSHMIYGFMKAAAEAIGRTLPKKNGTIMQSTSYTQSIINQHVRCEERYITFDRDILRQPNGEPAYFQRSLRAMTAQGPRISLAKSEVVPEGAKLRFTLKVLQNSPLTPEAINQLFQYGQLKGLGQWRSADYGNFIAEVMPRKN